MDHATTMCPSSQCLSHTHHAHARLLSSPNSASPPLPSPPTPPPLSSTIPSAPQVHHLLNLGAHVNQRDPRGLTPLHRAAHLAHLDGYLELYEYLLVGACVGGRGVAKPAQSTVYQNN